MIPTRHESKIPKTLSYPLGAEAISEALSTALHVEDFSLSFRNSPIWPASEFHRLLRESLPYKLMVVEHHPALKLNYAHQGVYNEEWNLRVNPVQRQLRQQAGELLKKQGFPAIIEWLRLSHQPGWGTRQHRLALVFNPAKGALTLQREDGA
jgi:hypothetical protein